jgi:hypothetical protein
MTKQIAEFLWRLLLFTVGCAFLHYFLLEYALARYRFLLPLWEVYLFLSMLTLLGYLAVVFIHHRDAGKTGMAFIAIGFLKMLAAVLFLYPVISSQNEGILAQVIAFFIPYFIFLGFDTYFTIALISKKEN